MKNNKLYWYCVGLTSFCILCALFIIGALSAQDAIEKPSPGVTKAVIIVMISGKDETRSLSRTTNLPFTPWVGLEIDGFLTVEKIGWMTPENQLRPGPTYMLFCARIDMPNKPVDEILPFFSKGPKWETIMVIPSRKR